MDTLTQCITAGLGDDRSGTPLVTCVRPRQPDGGAAAFGDLVPADWPRDIRDDDGMAWADAPPRGRRLLLLSSFISTADAGVGPAYLQDGWRGTPALAPVLLLRAILRAQPGQRIAALIPSSAFSAGYEAPRRALLDAADVALLAESDGAWAQALGMHASLRLTLLCLERRADGIGPGAARFLKVPRSPDADAFARELTALMRQGGGQTDHGYVEREPLDPKRPLLFAAFDPARRDRQSALRNLGEVRRLGDLVEISRGTVDRAAENKRSADGGIPLLTGKALRAAALSDVDLTPITSDKRHSELRDGDICIASISPPGELLRVRRIHADDLPLLADRHLLVLRPQPTLRADQLDFLLEYLQSPRAAALLSHETTGGLHIRVDQLRELLVPVPDETLLSVLEELRATRHQLIDWAAEVDDAVGGVLADTTDDSSILRLRSQGQILRQRVAAARQLDDLAYRVRNLFPFPVALPWRRAMTSSRDLEGYQGILECAESLTGYLAVLSVVLARHLDQDLGAVRSLRSKFENTRHGASMSDWTAIVREAAGQNLQKKASATTPLAELTELMADDTAAARALEDLTNMRNDLSHGRGPKGGQVPAAFDDAVAHLAQLYDCCQWLCDYPVRLIEETAWDSYEEQGQYTYRELIGDHYLVPQQAETTAVSTLNPGRLYLVDRNGDLHLISPLIVWHECDTCHLPSAFFLDRFVRETGECQMRAMDHNHSITRRDVTAPLARLGLVPAS